MMQFSVVRDEHHAMIYDAIYNKAHDAVYGGVYDKRHNVHNAVATCMAAALIDE